MQQQHAYTSKKYILLPPNNFSSQNSKPSFFKNSNYFKKYCTQAIKERERGHCHTFELHSPQSAFHSEHTRVNKYSSKKYTPIDIKYTSLHLPHSTHTTIPPAIAQQVVSGDCSHLVFHILSGIITCI